MGQKAFALSALLLVSGLAVLGYLCFEARAPEKTPMDDAQYPSTTPLPLRALADEAAAVDAAMRLTGLGRMAETISARRLTVAADDTPFLWPQIAGKRAWSVVFDGVSLMLPSIRPGEPEDPYRRRFTVLLEEDTGRLLGISSPFEPRPPDRLPRPPASTAEAQLRGAGEVYVDLPAIGPGVTFARALDTVRTKGIASPLFAEAIDGSYVIYSRLGSPPRAAWVVSLWGMPPYEPESWPGFTMPAWQRTHLRYVVDATTAEVLAIANVPQSVPPEP